MRHCIYAIAKNESENVGAFMAAAHECSLPVYVLDTGSADDTVERLLRAGAHVATAEIDPWAFDAARNTALTMVPETLDGFCVAVDLDERVLPILGKTLRENQFRNYTAIAYGYKPEAGVNPDWVTQNNRVHRRHGYAWHWPYHEGLVTLDPQRERIFETNDVWIEHYPRSGRSRTYTEGLSEAVKWMPGDERMNLLYARDLYNDGRIEHAETQFRLYLDLKPEDPVARSYALCMMARCCHRLKDQEGELAYLYQAVQIKPVRREALVELAAACRRAKRFVDALAYVEQALKITQGELWPHADPLAWGCRPYEIAMIVAYHIVPDITVAVKWGELALKRAKCREDKLRIQQNLGQLKSQ